MSDAYGLHCRECNKLVAVSTAESPDLGQTLREWARVDNTFIERHDVEVVRNLPFCDHALSESQHTHSHE